MVEPASEVELHQVVLANDLASLLADMISVRLDLDAAAQASRRIIESDLAERDPDLARALFEHGAIRYRRAWTTGRSLGTATQASRWKPLDEWLDELDNGALREAHADLLRVASKHVAHQTGEGLQQIQLSALLLPEGREVVDIAHLVVDLRLPTTLIDPLHRLAAGLIEAIDFNLESLKAGLLRICRDRIDELYDALPT